MNSLDKQMAKMASKRQVPPILAQNKQKAYQNIVLMPNYSMGHSRQNSAGGGSGSAGNSSQATFQDSLNSIVMMSSRGPIEGQTNQGGASLSSLTRASPIQ